MRFGCCGGLDSAGLIAQAGYDFLEMAVTPSLVPAEDEATFAEIKKQADALPLKVEAFNCFVPGSLKITGPEADLGKLSEYVQVVCERAPQLGGEVIVFGSGGARQVPDGTCHEEATSQIGEFLRMVNKHAKANGLTVVIEPLCTKECNILNTVAEGAELARRLGLSNIFSLADLYHIGQNEEPLDPVEQAGDMLRHVHLAHPITRKNPMPGDGYDYGPFFKALKAGGYDLRVSLECGWDNQEADAARTLEYLKDACAKA